MGEIKNLQGPEAIAKIIELGNDADVCIFCTYSQGKLISRPMSVRQFDEEGHIWFLSNRNSMKNKALETNAKVELLFAKGKDKYLSLSGAATVLFDKKKIAELWTPIAGIWFKDGKDDPDISVIRVHFKEGYYWDTKHGKMVEMALMATSLLTGKTMDDGIEGMLLR